MQIYVFSKKENATISTSFHVVGYSKSKNNKTKKKTGYIIFGVCVWEHPCNYIAASLENRGGREREREITNKQTNKKTASVCLRSFGSSCTCLMRKEKNLGWAKNEK